VTEESILAVQIFDQRKFKKKDQGFLGVVNVRIGGVIDLDAGGDGKAMILKARYTMPRLTLFPRNAHSRPAQIQRQSRGQRKADFESVNESLDADCEYESKRITPVHLLGRAFEQRRCIYSCWSTIKYITAS
jgi:E3 ubiquitin-protein ligase NEDD4